MTMIWGPCLENVKLPKGKYSVILIDPPWRNQAFTKERSGTPRRIEGDHYPTMTLDELKALPVAKRAASKCALFMWVIDTHLEQAFDLARHWGFRYSSIAFVWRKTTKHGKTHFGMGKTTRKQVEIVLLFMKDPPLRKSAGVRQYLEAEWIDSERREHSRKPDEQYERIEALYDGPYLEMFARQHREGWVSWGLEVDKFDKLDMPAKSTNSGDDDLMALLGAV